MGTGSDHFLGPFHLIRESASSADDFSNSSGRVATRVGDIPAGKKATGHSYGLRPDTMKSPSMEFQGHRGRNQHSPFTARYISPCIERCRGTSPLSASTKSENLHN